jgi:uncharacterized membrane protein YqgA involved in biofilm formation
MTGTIINIVTIIIGSTVGMIFGSRFPNRIRATVIAGLGLFTAAIGMQMFLKTDNAIIVLGSVLLGGILGEWWRIEEKLNALGGYFEHQFSKRATNHKEPTQEDNNQRDRFMRGFLTASLLFCVGPMTILGSIQDGLTGDYRLLATKAVLDGFASLAFASSLGIGVLFSITTVLVVQGGLSLLAAQAAVIITDPMMNEMTATGGLLLIGLAVSSLLEIKTIRVGNFLPALVLAPLIVVIITSLS